jgi:hypothetical protein
VVNFVPELVAGFTGICKYKGKKDVRIYDYLDISSGLTISMFKKRVSAYKQMGYEIETSENQKVKRWVGQASLF